MTDAQKPPREQWRITDCDGNLIGTEFTKVGVARALTELNGDGRALRPKRPYTAHRYILAPSPEAQPECNCNERHVGAWVCPQHGSVDGSHLDEAQPEHGSALADEFNKLITRYDAADAGVADLHNLAAFCMRNDAAILSALRSTAPSDDKRDARYDKLLATWRRTNDQICQMLGKALGYPWFKDDPKNFPNATEADGVCVGDHVAESLADEASVRLVEATRMLETQHSLLRYVKRHEVAKCRVCAFLGWTEESLAAEDAKIDAARAQLGEEK